jgi:hypothetical protein
MDADQINKIRELVEEYLGPYLFSVKKSNYKKILGKDEIPADLVDKLNLSARARLSKGDAGKWSLRDGDRAFSIVEEGDHLSISLMPRSTFEYLVLPGREVLFEVNRGREKDLDGQKVSGEWRQIFEKYGFPLSAGAGVEIKGTGKKKK